MDDREHAKKKMQTWKVVALAVTITLVGVMAAGFAVYQIRGSGNDEEISVSNEAGSDWVEKTREVVSGRRLNRQALEECTEADRLLNSGDYASAVIHMEKASRLLQEALGSKQTTE